MHAGFGPQARQALSCHDRLARVYVYVELAYHKDISLASAARVAGLEPTYFSKYFHAKTGICFRDWLARTRVEHAKELLGSRDLTVAEVSRRVGFHSVRTFERQFRRLNDATPRDFQASRQGRPPRL